MDRDAVARRRGRRARGAALVAAFGLVAALLPIGPEGGASTAARQDGSDVAVVDALVGVELPPVLGQSDLSVYVEATGHTIGGVFLDYWRATGGAAGFGDPISEPFAAANGYYSQAFENAVVQYRPEVVWTVEPIMRLLPLGTLALEERVGAVRADGRRGFGGGDRFGAAWRALDPNGETVARIVDEGGVFVESTGHTIAGDFLTWYELHEGDFYLGDPLGEPMLERGRTVQYFEGGVLVDGPEGVGLAPLAAAMVDRLGVETAAVPRGGLPTYDEALFWVADNPYPVGSLRAAGPKRIEVDISEQRIWAYQGETVVSTGLVSTGVEPNGTELGRFRVRYKVLLEDMRGFTDATGEVIGVVDETAPEQPVAADAVASYAVEDVPHVMYVNMDAEALHGAYWHENFGTPMSHGCINLPLAMAAFLFGWAPLGTPVWVHE